MKTQTRLLMVLISIILLSLISYSDEITVIEVTEGDLVNLKVSATDADEDVLEYTYDEPLDEEGQWQTGYGDYGEYETSITVSDGQVEVTQQVLIKVIKANWPPVLEEFEDMVINEGDIVVIEPRTTDEEGDEITYTISYPVGNDGIWETTYEDAGDYKITVTATDNKHDPVEEEFLIVVEDINRDPDVAEYIPKEEDVKVNEGEEKTFLISAEDFDKDELTYNWELDDEEVSTEKSFTYAPDYESAGEHFIKGTVSDGRIVMGIKWNIEVIDTNRVPILEEFEDIIVNEGELVKVEFTATDSDGDDIKYDISEPVGPDKEWQTTYDDAGTYEVELLVSDGKEEISQTFNVIVKDVDRAPEFADIEDVTITEEESVEFTLEATDPDGDIITFSAENMPPGAALIGDKFTFNANYETVFKAKH